MDRETFETWLDSQGMTKNEFAKWFGIQYKDKPVGKVSQGQLARAIARFNRIADDMRTLPNTALSAAYASAFMTGLATGDAEFTAMMGAQMLAKLFRASTSSKSKEKNQLIEDAQRDAQENVETEALETLQRTLQMIAERGREEKGSADQM
jgi:hypothetical protein